MPTTPDTPQRHKLNPRGKANKRVHFKVSNTMYDELFELASKHHVSMSTVVRCAIKVAQYSGNRLDRMLEEEPF